MKIILTPMCVEGQAVARRFYTEVLGFSVKRDFPVGEFTWLSGDPRSLRTVLVPHEGLRLLEDIADDGVLYPEKVETFIDLLT